MIWSRLKNFECPECKGILTKDELSAAYFCLKCNFEISEKKFNDIVSDMYNHGSKRSMTLDDFNSGEFDQRDEHDAFWLNAKAHE